MDLAGGGSGSRGFNVDRCNRFAWHIARLNYFWRHVRNGLGRWALIDGCGRRETGKRRDGERLGCQPRRLRLRKVEGTLICAGHRHIRSRQLSQRRSGEGIALLGGDLQQGLFFHRRWGARRRDGNAIVRRRVAWQNDKMGKQRGNAEPVHDARAEHA